MESFERFCGDQVQRIGERLAIETKSERLLRESKVRRHREALADLELELGLGIIGHAIGPRRQDLSALDGDWQ